MPSNPFINFGIQRYYQIELKFNGVFLKNSLPKIKDGAYVINPDKYKSNEIHWIALYVNGENVIYFDSFELSIFQKKLKSS